MLTSPTKTEEVCAAWFESNTTARCIRLSSTITIATCEANRAKSENKGTDYRCAGCNGLADQPEPGRSFLPLIIAAEPELDEKLNDGFAALDEIIAQHFEHPDPADDFDNVELELDDEALLALFPELYKGDDDTEPESPRFTERQTAQPRYAVYKGRCKRCGGYMDNIREWYDDNVFRCLACGWRTAPEYENNRAINRESAAYK